MIRDSVSRFVSNDVIPLMAESYEHAHFPKELIKKSA
ncbi:acyl-CoA dehydrogenase family protein, partial [Pseudomonas aeruginosa]